MWGWRFPCLDSIRRLFTDDDSLACNMQNSKQYPYRKLRMIKQLYHDVNSECMRLEILYPNLTELGILMIIQENLRRNTNKVISFSPYLSSYSKKEIQSYLITLIEEIKLERKINYIIKINKNIPQYEDDRAQLIIDHADENPEIVAPLLMKKCSVIVYIFAKLVKSDYYAELYINVDPIYQNTLRFFED